MSFDGWLCVDIDGEDDDAAHDAFRRSVFYDDAQEEYFSLFHESAQYWEAFEEWRGDGV